MRKPPKVDTPDLPPPPTPPTLASFIVPPPSTAPRNINNIVFAERIPPLSLIRKQTSIKRTLGS